MLMFKFKPQFNGQRGLLNLEIEEKKKKKKIFFKREFSLFQQINARFYETQVDTPSVAWAELKSHVWFSRVS